MFIDKGFEFWAAFTLVTLLCSDIFLSLSRLISPLQPSSVTLGHGHVLIPILLFWTTIIPPSPLAPRLTSSGPPGGCFIPPNLVWLKRSTLVLIYIIHYVCHSWLSPIYFKILMILLTHTSAGSDLSYFYHSSVALLLCTCSVIIYCVLYYITLLLLYHICESLLWQLVCLSVNNWCIVSVLQLPCTSSQAGS